MLAELAVPDRGRTDSLEEIDFETRFPNDCRDGSPALLTLDPQKYISFSVTPRQFAEIEKLCSSSRLGDTLGGAVDWVRSHGQELHLEALRNLKNKEIQEYETSNEECRYYCDKDGSVAIYETWSGTIFSVRAQSWGDQFEVSIPDSRANGYHHEKVKEVLAGLSADQIDNAQSLYRYRGLELVEEKIKVLTTHNEILVPQGHPRHRHLEQELRKDAAELVAEGVMTNGQARLVSAIIEAGTDDPTVASLLTDPRYAKHIEDDY